MNPLQAWLDAQILAGSHYVELWRLTVPQALVGRWPLRVEHLGCERPLEEQLAALTRVQPRGVVGHALFAYDEGASESRARALVRDGELLREPSVTRRRIIDGLLAECEAIACMQRRLERARASLGALRR
jgi:hypothetical protein